MMGGSMISARMMIAAAALAALPAGPAPAQDNGVIRYGNTSAFHFDARNDDRDIPTNGFFPGNFATDPPLASIGAAGFLESNPYRSPRPYPSQVIFPWRGNAAPAR
jgi:hypothetical protein